MVREEKEARNNRLLNLKNQFGEALVYHADRDHESHANSEYLRSCPGVIPGITAHQIEK